MTCGSSEAIPAVVTMKLDGEDYENIYLRVRGKMWKQVAAAIAFVGLGVAGAGWAYMSKLTEKAIAEYVQSDAFKNGVRADALSRVNDLEKRSQSLTDLIEKQQRAIGGLAQLPLSVTENGLVLVDPKGKQFSIEMGEVVEGEEVKFTSSYKNPPMVLVTSIGERQVIRTPLSRDRGSMVSISRVTLDGFKMPVGNRVHAFKPRYRWIAIGG